MSFSYIIKTCHPNQPGIVDIPCDLVPDPGMNACDTAPSARGVIIDQFCKQ